MHQKTILFRIIGYVASLLLTLGAFFIVLRPDFFNLGFKDAVLIIIIFALLQFLFQFVFFLDLWREKGSHWNLIVFASTISIILIIITFSIWIMNHLNYRMMM